MTFAEWKELSPASAAREVRRRAETQLAAVQRSAAIACLVDEAALEAALGAAAPASPLRGVPYFLKDLFDAHGLPTFAGSSFLPEVRQTPPKNSAIVRDLSAAGAAMAGKTHLFEFAWGLTGENAHYGDCERPGFPGRTSGGSSSGSAAVVAADIVPLAIGTDTGGSIRVPAAFCGIFGYRGSPGGPWMADAVPLAPSFDAAGWFARSAWDMRQAIEALVGLRPSDKAPKGCYLEMPGLDPDVAEACRNDALEFSAPADAGTRDDLLAAFSPAAEIYGVMAGRESWTVHRKWAEKHRMRYGPLVQERLERARTVSQAQAAAVRPSQEALREAWTMLFLSHDFLVMPAVPFGALAKADCTAESRLRMLALTAPASLGALPVLTLPVPLPSGLSAGLQVVVNHPQSPVIPWILDNCRQSSV